MIVWLSLALAGPSHVQDAGMVDGEPRMLGLSTQRIALLDPAAPPVIMVYTSGIDAFELWVHKVRTKDFGAFASAETARIAGDVARPGRVVHRATIGVEGQGVQSTPVDLSPWFRDGPGHVVVTVHRQQGDATLVHQSWLERTGLGIDGWRDDDQLQVNAFEVATGSPLADVEVSVGKTRVRTDDDGLATLAVDQGFLVVRQGDDEALVPLYDLQTVDGPGRADPRWGSFDNGTLVLPGTAATLRGWRLGFGREAMVPAPGTARWEAKDAQGVVGGGQVTVEADGSYALQLELPSTAEGPVTVRLGEGAHAGEVVVQTAPPSDGAPLSLDLTSWRPGEDVQVTVQQDASPVSGPLSWKARELGDPIDLPGVPGYAVRSRRTKTDSWSSQTPADGSFAFHPAGTEPVRVVIDASVGDTSASRTVTLWPASTLVGLRVAPVQTEGAIAVETRVVDPEGQPVEAVADVVAYSHRWVASDEGGWEAAEREVARCEPSADACELTVSSAGRHRIEAVVHDADGRTARASVFTWVQGNADASALDLVPSPSGVLVSSPVAPASGTLRTSTGEVRPLQLKASPTLLPGTQLHALDLALHGRDASGRPASARGGLDLADHPLEARFVEVSEGSVTLQITGPDGPVADARVSLEAAYATAPDPGSTGVRLDLANDLATLDASGPSPTPAWPLVAPSFADRSHELTPSEAFERAAYRRRGYVAGAHHVPPPPGGARPPVLDGRGPVAPTHRRDPGSERGVLARSEGRTDADGHVVLAIESADAGQLFVLATAGARVGRATYDLIVE